MPKQVDDEQELTEEELLQRIIEYKKYKEITNRLRDMYRNSSNNVFKLPETIELPKQKLEREYKHEIISSIYAEIIEKSANRLNQNAKNIEKIAYYIVKHLFLINYFQRRNAQIKKLLQHLQVC